MRRLFLSVELKDWKNNNYQLVQSEVSPPPYPRIEEPEDEGTHEVVAREENIDREVHGVGRLLHGDGGDDLEDGPGSHHDDEGQGHGRQGPDQAGQCLRLHGESDGPPGGLGAEQHRQGRAESRPGQEVICLVLSGLTY